MAARGTSVAAGGSGFVFMDVTLAKEATLPKALRHRFTISVAKAPGEPASGDHDPAPAPPEQLTFVTDPLSVGPAAIVVAPPLKVRAGWRAADATPYSYHRGATLPLNGAVRVAERFAIDFVQLNDENRLNSGPIDQLSSYAYFGTRSMPWPMGRWWKPRTACPSRFRASFRDATIEMAAGNHVVVDIGDGRFAFYAHMQPGSVRVKVGDKVKTGQVLGLLGIAARPICRICISMSWTGPSPLVSNGLPSPSICSPGRGASPTSNLLFTGGVVTIDKDALSGPHANELPLLDQVLSFP